MQLVEPHQENASWLNEFTGFCENLRGVLTDSMADVLDRITRHLGKLGA